MCCLGFLAQACGYDEAELLRQPSPHYVRERAGVNKFPKGMFDEFGNHHLTVGELIASNDGVARSEYEREKSIAYLMSRLGVEVSFVD